MTNFEKIFQNLGELNSTAQAILEQTKKTNGRVTKLEERVEVIDNTLAVAKGYRKSNAAMKTTIIAFLTFVLGSIIVPIVSAYISQK